MLPRVNNMPFTPAITTISLGQSAHHSLESKLCAAARHGVFAVELFFDDLDVLAGCPPLEPHALRAAALMEAARTARDLCRELGVVILNLQPFRFYEGLVDRAESSRLLNQELPLWLDLLDILETDTILVASNFLGPDPKTGAPRTSGDAHLIASDLRELADAAGRRSPPVRIAYEAIAWANHVWLWEQAWDLVRAVDRPNMGLALDTFNLAGATYADPTMPSGTLANSDDTAIVSLGESLGRLADTVDFGRVFVVQIADGERLDRPLLEDHPFYVAGQPTRMSWSRNARLFPCESDRGGYLPILEIVRCFIALGWNGPMPFEVFSRTLSDPNSATPDNHARRAALSWAAMSEALLPTTGGEPEKVRPTEEFVELVAVDVHESPLVQEVVD